MNIFVAFTTWNIIFIILHPIIHDYIDVLLTSLVTLVVSTYFVLLKGHYFHMYINGTEYHVNTILVQASHFISHIIPFIIILVLEKNYKIDYMRMVTSLLLMYIYMLVVDVENLYKIKREEMVLLVILSILILHW